MTPPKNGSAAQRILNNNQHSDAAALIFSRTRNEKARCGGGLVRILERKRAMCSKILTGIFAGVTPGVGKTGFFKLARRSA